MPDQPAGTSDTSADALSDDALARGQEALAGATCHAARALGLQHETGSLVVGKRADFALWRIARPADLAYALGLNPCAGVVHGGVWRAPVVSLPD